MSTTYFWLIRHGETQWNADRRLQGWRDIALNESGIEQARCIARHLRSSQFITTIDAIVSSDLSRALETARIGASHLPLPIQTHSGLRERNFGIYEGQDWIRLTNETARQTGLNLRDPRQFVEQGETLFAFRDRVQDTFHELARHHGPRNILVFTHGGVIDMVWRRATQSSLEAPRPDQILNCSVNQFSIAPGDLWRLTDWGQTGHLNTRALDDAS